jgi:hypothetical protein
MTTRGTSSEGGCAWFLLLIIVSMIVGFNYGAGTGWLVFFVVLLFVAFL